MSNIFKIKNSKFCEIVPTKRIPIYDKTTITTTTAPISTIAPFTENLYSFSHKHNLAYPEQLVIYSNIECHSF